MPKTIITGSSGLIGTEVTKYLRKQGHKVIPCDFKLGHDLNDEKFVKEFFAKHKAENLVNLFALNDHVDKDREVSTLFNISLESFEKFLTVNLTSLFSVCRQYAVNNRQGSIVNFSGAYGLVSPLPDLYNDGMKHVGYCVSKAGVVQLTKYLAVHLAPNVRVNCIAPGGVFHKQDNDFIHKYNAHVPMRRMMFVSELNGLVEYLCSDKSSYMTGATLNLDGGWTAW